MQVLVPHDHVSERFSEVVAVHHRLLPGLDHSLESTTLRHHRLHQEAVAVIHLRARGPGDRAGGGVGSDALIVGLHERRQGHVTLCRARCPGMAPNKDPDPRRPPGTQRLAEAGSGKARPALGPTLPALASSLASLCDQSTRAQACAHLVVTMGPCMSVLDPDNSGGGAETTGNALLKDAKTTDKALNAADVNEEVTRARCSLEIAKSRAG